MIIHYNCTRQFLVALVFADLPSLSPSFHEMIFILVPPMVVAKLEHQGAPKILIRAYIPHACANIYAACALAQTAPLPAE